MASSQASFYSGRTDRRDSLFNKGGKIRPMTPDSLSSEDEVLKLTRDQHICINNLGMAAAFFLPLGLISTAVAFGTNYWFNIQHYYVGLFRRCDNWTQSCDSVSAFYDEDNTDSLKITWTVGVPLLLTGGCMLLLALATLTCYPCHRKVNFSKMACAVTVGIIMVTGFLALMGGFALFIIYAISNPNSASLMWSFYCACIGIALALVATILFLVHVCYTGCYE